MSKIPQVKEFGGLPVVTPDKMRWLDVKAVTEYGVPEGQLMENAGQAVAVETLRIAREELGKEPSALRAAVLCGRGNNGGDGLAAARRLKAAGAYAKIFILAPGEKGYSRLAVENLEKARAAGVEITLLERDSIEALAAELPGFDLQLDALLGAGASGKPTGPVKRVIQLMNKAGRPIIAVDIPSGLLPDSGHHTGVFVIAKHTLTLGFAKTGLMAPHAQKNIGTLKVLDIGYPEKLVQEARG